jgi:hypothetical protein
VCNIESGNDIEFVLHYSAVGLSGTVHDYMRNWFYLD